MKIILGSSSPWRKMILEKMGYQFEVMNPDIDEKSIGLRVNPSALTIKLAMAKQKAILPRVTEPVVLITSDQVVVCDKVIREKPENADECRNYLCSYREHPAKTVTAVLVRNTETRWEGLIVDEATMWFKDLTDVAIESLIADGTVMNCAGGFAAGAEIFQPYVERLEGELESLMGLPKMLTDLLIKDSLNTEMHLSPKVIK